MPGLPVLTRFLCWWLARLAELTPASWTGRAAGPRGSIVIDIDNGGEIALLVRRRNGRDEVISLDAAARLAVRNAVLLRPSAGSVLQKRHTVPTMPRRQLDQVLWHELARITPFAAEELVWRWDAHAKPGYQRNTTVTLTMVPKRVLAAACAKLGDAGIAVDALLVGSQRLAVGNDRSRGTVVGGLAWTCVGLAAVALVLPIGLQALARHQANAAIAALRPAVAEVEALKAKAAEADTNQGILRREAKRAGGPVRILAALTRSLPDDTFLTDLTLRERQITLSGRSTSAARLVTTLSADPEIRSVAFAAPVVRVEGAERDIFSIQAEMAKP